MTLRILFFGLGSIGRRHARLISNNFEHHLFAFRNSKRSKPNKLGIKDIKVYVDESKESKADEGGGKIKNVAPESNIKIIKLASKEESDKFSKYKEHFEVYGTFFEEDEDKGYRKSRAS